MSNARNLANLLGTNTTIQTANLADSAVSTAKLADSAVTSAKLPSGSIIQVKNFSWTAQSNTNSTSFTSMGQIGAMTTTRANSKILITTNIPLQVYGAENTRYQIVLRHSVDSYAANLSSHPAVNYAAASGDWVMPHLGWNALHDHSQSVGTTINYRTYIKKNVGSQNAYYADFWGDSGAFETTMMEIVD